MDRTKIKRKKGIHKQNCQCGICKRRIVDKEIRYCLCGCGRSKKVSVNRGWKMFKQHWSRIKEIQDRANLKRRKAMKGRVPWSKGLSAKTNSIIANSLAKRLKSCQAEPNKFEVKALEHLNKLFGNVFQYTGNGTLMSGGCSADAYSKELNMVALFHGYYWHLKRIGLEVNEENKRRLEANDALPFLLAGYKVIVIWEDELKKQSTSKNIVHFIK